MKEAVREHGRLAAAGSGAHGRADPDRADRAPTAPRWGVRSGIELVVLERPRLVTADGRGTGQVLIARVGIHVEAPVPPPGRRARADAFGDDLG